MGETPTVRGMVSEVLGGESVECNVVWEWEASVDDVEFACFGPDNAESCDFVEPFAGLRRLHHIICCGLIKEKIIGER